MSLSQTSYLVRKPSTDLYIKGTARKDRSFVAFHISRNRANGRRLVEEANVARAPDIVVPYIMSSRLSSSPCSWKRRRRVVQSRSRKFLSERARAIFRPSSCVKRTSGRKKKNRDCFCRAPREPRVFTTYGSFDAYSTRIRRLLYLSALSPSAIPVSPCQVRCQSERFAIRARQTERETERI